MITPANFLTNNHLAPLRRFLLQRTKIEHILVIHEGVFRRVSVDSAIFVATAGGPTKRQFPVQTAAGATLQKISERSVSVRKALGDELVLFTGSTEKGGASLWKKIADRSLELGTIADVNFGKQLRDRASFPEDVITVSGLRSIPEGYVPCYTGADVSRYRVTWGKLACVVDERARRGGCWDRAKHEAKNKILSRQIGLYPEFALDTRGYHCLNTMFMINVRDGAEDPLWILGVLNSRLVRAMWLDRFSDPRKTFPKIKGTYLKLLPLPMQGGTLAGSAELTNIVAQILEMRTQLANTRTGHEAAVLGRRVEALERKVDDLIFRLYELSASEVEVVNSILSSQSASGLASSRKTE